MLKRLLKKFNQVFLPKNKLISLKKRKSKIKIIGNPKNVFLGKNCIVDESAKFDVSQGGIIKIGDNCVILQGVIISTYGGSIEVGNNCSFNPYCVIYGHGGLKIGDGVRIATHSVIIPANHNYSDINIPIYRQGLSMKGIKIEDDVWIGAGVKILDGVNIGTGVIVGAGSVVTKNLEAYGIFAGQPASLINHRLHD